MFHRRFMHPMHGGKQDNNQEEEKEPFDILDIDGNKIEINLDKNHNQENQQNGNENHEEQNDENQNQNDSTEKEDKHENQKEQGPISDSPTRIRIKEPELIVILKQRCHLENEKIYDEEPTFESSELISILPQLKAIQQDYMNEYDHQIAHKYIRPLIKYLEREYSWLTHRLEKMLQEDKITFQHVWYLYQKDGYCYKMEEGHPVAGIIKHGAYKKNMFGGTNFYITVEIINSDGKNFITNQKQWVIPSFEGTRNISELSVKPLKKESELYQKLKERGKLFEKYAIGTHYLHYEGVIHRRSFLHTVRYEATGRCVVDSVSFRRFNQDSVDNDFMNTEFDEMGRPIDTNIKSLPEHKLFMTWPFVQIFSLAVKQWGNAAVSNFKPVQFDTNAFDQLVLPHDKKKLIRALVEHNDLNSFSDIISNKGEKGLVFLLHGPPGTGKTISAESIAELLKRPLYSISAGELGTNSVSLEENLRQILELCQRWNALCLIDEADVFLEKRTQHDIERNALVGIFLRLLEYSQTILFLTTNRVSVFDTAVKSRVSVALKYPSLEQASRFDIWKHLLERQSNSKIEHLTDEQIQTLSSYELNGRQIKNIIRMAQSLAISESQNSSTKENSLQYSHLIESVRLTQQFDIETGLPSDAQPYQKKGETS